MRLTISLDSQARVLRAQTGHSLAHCKRILKACELERDRNVAIKRRHIVESRQLELTEARASDFEIEQCFAEIRRNLQEARS